MISSKMSVHSILQVTFRKTLKEVLSRFFHFVISKRVAADFHGRISRRQINSG